MSYTARVTYRVDGRAEPFRDSYTLDLTFLLGMRRIERKSLHDAAKAIEDIQVDLHRWTEHLNGIRVYVVDHERYEREQEIGMVLSKVVADHSGRAPDEIRTALRDAFKAIGEEIEPSDKWVNAIAEGRHFRFELEDLSVSG